MDYDEFDEQDIAFDREQEEWYEKQFEVMLKTKSVENDLWSWDVS